MEKALRLEGRSALVYLVVGSGDHAKQDLKERFALNPGNLKSSPSNKRIQDCAAHEEKEVDNAKCEHTQNLHGTKP